jgi:putative hemolysin
MSRITQGTKLHVLLVSSDGAEVVPLPAQPPPSPAARPPGAAAASVATPNAAAFGCGAAGFAIETRDASGGPSLTTCTLEGSCAAPKTSPFSVWPEPHSRAVAAATTPRGTLALMSAQAGERWGVYLAQSSDAGHSYELPRVVGEGSGERGRLEIGGLVSLGNRALLLVAADVVGTSRRGWYVLASDDGGATWAPP